MLLGLDAAGFQQSALLKKVVKSWYNVNQYLDDYKRNQVFSWVGSWVQILPAKSYFRKNLQF